MFVVTFSTFLIAGLISVLLLYLVWRYYSTNRIRILVDKFPGPKALPIIGNALDFYFNRTEIAKILYGNDASCSNFRLWIAGKPIIYLSNVDDVQEILSSSSHITKTPEYDFFIPWLEYDLFTSSGNKWRKFRKVFARSFNFRILEEFITVFNTQTRVLIEQITKEIAQHDTFDVLPFTSPCVFDILCETVMGIKSYTQLKKNSVLLNAIDKIKKAIHARQFRMLLWPDILFNMSAIGKMHNQSIKLAHEFSENVVKANSTDREMRKQNNQPPKKIASFLDLLLELRENGENLSDAAIRAETDGFVLAGHDTIASAIGWALFLVASHPNVQNKVHQEVDQVFGDQQFKELKADDLKKLTYLECVIKESLRRITTVPIIGRQLLNDVVLKDGRIIPAGVSVYINILKIHKNPDLYQNPDKFDPDRFLPENCQNRHPYAFIPFSAGPRNCLGQKFAVMEEKVILSHVFRSFSVHAVETLEEVKQSSRLTTNARNGIKLQFKSRI